MVKVAVRNSSAMRGAAVVMMMMMMMMMMITMMMMMMVTTTTTTTVMMMVMAVMVVVMMMEVVVALQGEEAQPLMNSPLLPLGFLRWPHHPLRMTRRGSGGKERLDGGWGWGRGISASPGVVSVSHLEAGNAGRSGAGHQLDAAIEEKLCGKAGEGDAAQSHPAKSPEVHHKRLQRQKGSRGVNVKSNRDGV